MEQDTTVMDDTRRAPSAAPGPALPDLAASIEAILLTVDKPVTTGRLAEALGLVPPEAPSADPAEPAQPSPPRRRAKAAPGGDHASAADRIQGAIADLNRQYEATGRAFRIEPVAGGHRLMTLPAFAPTLAAFHRTRAASRLSRAAVETLAVIAYKQPITRAHLEAIRGVSCGEVLRSLLERRLVTIKGRAEELGRPILYGTTREFLDAFGLATLKDLPSSTEFLGEPAPAPPVPATQTEP
ncbi:MAG: SMC-Scp complex subunit ScpB [Phycisphaerales bacterium]